MGAISWSVKISLKHFFEILKIASAGHKKAAPSCCFQKKKQKQKQKKQGPGVIHPPPYMTPGSF